MKSSIIYNLTPLATSFTSQIHIPLQSLLNSTAAWKIIWAESISLYRNLSSLLEYKQNFVMKHVTFALSFLKVEMR